MSQMQSEVRPQVLRMPKTGFSLQTGGSARRRIIKPFTKQASTNQFPIENKYRVSGVPGHTHNSSAVMSVLVDLKQSRNFTAALTDAWTHTGVNFAAADPGDSAVVEDEHARFDRAIERGVGDICLRPENCHQEIREPVRSISEVRTLVAPDDRLQTMTYVEEVGGFVNQDTSQFVSDFPDVLVDFLGPHDLNLAARTGGAATALTAAAAATPLLLLGDGEATHNIVVLRPADGSSVGFVDGPTDWNGIVPFRWDSAKMVYRAEPFVVTLRRVVQVLKVAPHTNVAEQALRIRFDAVETTRAEHGNCFIMAEGINNTQAIRSATAANAAALVPKLSIDVLDIVSLGNFKWRLPTPYRIKVGSDYALPGPDVFAAADSYFKRLRNITMLGLSEQWRYLTEHDATAIIAVANSQFPDISHQFGYFMTKFLSNALKLPLVLDRNKHKGALWHGVDPYPTITNCMNTDGYDNVEVSTINATNHGAGYEIIKRAIARAKAALGGGTTDDQAWLATYTNPLYAVQFQTTHQHGVNFEFVQDGVRPPALDEDSDEFYDWRKIIEQIVFDAGGAQIRHSPDGSFEDALVPENEQIPALTKWVKVNESVGKNITHSVYGAGFGFAPVNVAATYTEKVVMIPFQARYFRDKHYLPLEYIEVTDENGIPDDELSYIGLKDAHKLSHRFFVITDVVQSGEATAPRVTASFDLSEMNNTHAALTISDYIPLPDLRHAGSAGLRNYFSNAYGVGNTIEIKIVPDALDQYFAAGDDKPILVHTVTGGGDTVTVFQDMVFSFKDNRTFFMMFNDVGVTGNRKAGTILFFHSKDCVARYHLRNDTVHAITTVTKVFSGVDGSLVNAANDLITTAVAASPGAHKTSCLIGQLGPKFQYEFLEETTMFDGIIADSNGVGPVFQSQRRISQHLCAPVLNPNARIGCTAPLNYETMHLPPELRDFQLELRDIDFSFLPGKVSLEPLVFYEFNGGNQTVAAEDNLLHLPQFREFTTTKITVDGTFDLECFSPYGMPSYIAAFARDQDRSRNHMAQPLIKQLNIMCNTTMKKSNTILDADVHQLYHITQRNVNQRARYNRFTFNKRQVILMSAEDVGLMGLERYEYQSEKRAVFRFRGLVDQLCRITILLIYNNRGLYVDGKQFGVVRLQN